MIRMQNLDLLARYIESQVAAIETRQLAERDAWQRSQWQLAVEEALRFEPVCS